MRSAEQIHNDTCFILKGIDMVLNKCSSKIHKTIILEIERLKNEVKLEQLRQIIDNNALMLEIEKNIKRL